MCLWNFLWKWRLTLEKYVFEEKEFVNATDIFISFYLILGFQNQHVASALRQTPFPQKGLHGMTAGLIYKRTVTSLNIKPMGSCAVVVLFHSLQWRHVGWSTGNTTGWLAHSRVLDLALSVVSFQLRPSWSSQSLLSCERRISVVICQVLKKYLTWVNSIYNRTQRRFLWNHFSIWKARCLSVCVYVRWVKYRKQKVENLKKITRTRFVLLSHGWEDK